MTREHETSLSYLHSLVSDVFNLLEVGLLIRIEHQLLEVQSSQPVLNSPSRLCLSIPRCGAGAGLADAHARGDRVSRVCRCGLLHGSGSARRAAHAGPTNPLAVGDARG